MVESDNKVVIVLGMHRSGTSALTGSIEAGGIYLGSTNHSSPDNLKGNRESTHIMALHNDLLARNGGSWDKPVQNLKWDPIHRAFRDAIIECYADKRIWGFKDPRTIFALRGWLDVLPDANLLGIYRHPFLVADSLFKRDGICYEDGLALWLSYNRALVWHLERHSNCSLIEFTVDADQFKNQLNMVASKLSLSEQTTTFFDSSLRHSTIPDLVGIQNANQALQLYKKLSSHRIDSK